MSTIVKRLILYLLLTSASAVPAIGQSMVTGKEYVVPREAWGEAEIYVANLKLTAALWRGDPAVTAALYTRDGQLHLSGTHAIAGRGAIEEYWTKAFDAGLMEAYFETDELELWLNSAHEVGRYTLRGAGGQALDYGSYVVLWKREDGMWKRHREVFTSRMIECLPVAFRRTATEAQPGQDRHRL